MGMTGSMLSCDLMIDGEFSNRDNSKLPPSHHLTVSSLWVRVELSRCSMSFYCGLSLHLSGQCPRERDL